MECHKKFNFTRYEMSQRIKFHKMWNPTWDKFHNKCIVTKDEMQQNMKSQKRWNANRCESMLAIASTPFVACMEAVLWQSTENNPAWEPS